MGGVNTDSGESLNTELNLVPFIDLLSSLVLFLLITAVWVQISAIPTGIDTKGSVPLLDSNKNNILSIHLNEKGYELTWPTSIPESWKLPRIVEKKDQSYDYAQLNALLTAAVQGGAKPLTSVSADDTIEYGEVIQAIDTAKLGGLETVAISTN